MAELLKEKVRVRYVNKPFSLDGNDYKRGSLVITKGDNKYHSDFTEILKNILKNHSHKELTVVNTGFVDIGKDFGSRHVDVVKDVKIAAPQIVIVDGWVLDQSDISIGDTE